MPPTGANSLDPAEGSLSLVARSAISAALARKSESVGTTIASTRATSIAAKVATSPLAFCTSSTFNSKFSAFAVARMFWSCSGLPGLAGLISTATRVIRGTASLRNSSLLAPASRENWMDPVMFPPGRERLLLSPAATGSPMTGSTMGIVGSTPLPVRATDRSSRRPLEFRRRCSCPRRSLGPAGPCAMLRPGWTLRKASRESEGRPEKPFVLAARTTRAALRAHLRSVQRRIVGERSLDQLIRAQQQRLRNCQAERLRRLEVDHQLKLGGLLNRQVSRTRAFEYLVHVGRYSPVPFDQVPPLPIMPPAPANSAFPADGSRCLIARAAMALALTPNIVSP